jgi:predicted DNA-binding ribbon-helix-helix protein
LLKIPTRHLPVPCHDRQKADILLDMVTNRSSTKRGRRLSLRLSEALAVELEATAEREHRPVSDYVRHLLIDAVAARIVQNEQSTAGA